MKFGSTKNLHCFSTATATENDVTSVWLKETDEVENWIQYDVFKTFPKL